MPSHRSLRIAEAIREVLSTAILFEVSDPRVQGVTVLRVEVPGDLRTATAFVTIMGTETQQKLAMKGLRHASGFLQARMANRLQTRSTPVLSFKLDDSVKKSVEISRLIDDALVADSHAGKPTGGDLEDRCDDAGPLADPDDDIMDPESNRADPD